MKNTVGVCTVIVILCLGIGLFPTMEAAAQSSPQSAKDLVSGIYGLVSSTGGKLPDWDKVRSCFINEAVIVLRTSRRRWGLRGDSTACPEGAVQHALARRMRVVPSPPHCRYHP